MEDKDFCLKLIKAVKRRPCLYDFTMNEYAREAIDNVWKEVGAELNADGLKCKEKWRNIKVVMKRHLRKGVIKRRRKYYLFDHLRFIIPYMGVRDPQTYDTPIPPPPNKQEISDENIDTDPLLEEATTYIQTEMSDDTQFTNTETYNNVSLLDHTYNDETLIEEDYNYHVPVHTEINPRKRKTSEGTHDIKKKYHVDVNTDRKKEEEDAKKSFLMSLLPDLNQMNGQQTRYFKKCVLEIVEEILDGDMSATFRAVDKSNIRSQKMF